MSDAFDGTDVDALAKMKENGEISEEGFQKRMDELAQQSMASFMASMEEYQKTDREEAQKAFNYFDSDGSGSIDAVEFQRLVFELGSVISDEEADKVLKELDTDGNGEISFNEFMQWWTDFDSTRSDADSTDGATVLRLKLRSWAFLKSIEGGFDTLRDSQVMYLNQSNKDLNSPTPTEEAKEEEEEWPAEEPISGRSKIHFGAQFGGYEWATTQLFSLRLVQDATKASSLKTHLGAEADNFVSLAFRLKNDGQVSEDDLEALKTAVETFVSLSKKKTIERVKYAKYFDSEANAWLWRFGGELNAEKTGPVGFFLPELGLQTFGVSFKIDASQPQKAGRFDFDLDIARSYLNLVRTFGRSFIPLSAFKFMKSFKNFDLNLDFDTLPDLLRDKGLTKTLGSLPMGEAVKAQAAEAADKNLDEAARAMIEAKLKDLAKDERSWALMQPFYAAAWRCFADLNDLSIVFDQPQTFSLEVLSRSFLEMTRLGDYFLEVKVNAPGGFASFLPDPATLPQPAST